MVRFCEVFGDSVCVSAVYLVVSNALDKWLISSPHLCSNFVVSKTHCPYCNSGTTLSSCLSQLVQTVLSLHGVVVADIGELICSKIVSLLISVITSQKFMFYQCAFSRLIAVCGVIWWPNLAMVYGTNNLAGGSCATSEGCDLARRHISHIHHAADFPAHNISAHWLDRTVRFPSGSSGCSSADGQAYCVANDGIYGYNSKGRVWSSTILSDKTGVTSSVVTATPSGQVSQILSKDVHTLAVIEPSSGFVDDAFNVSGCVRACARACASVCFVCRVCVRVRVGL